MAWENLSASEYYGMFGTLTTSHIEGLLEVIESGDTFEALKDKCGDAEGMLDDASASFPEEDFLSDVIRRMGNLAKSVRGENKATIIEIIETLESISQDTHNNTGYGLDEIRKAVEEITYFKNERKS